MVEETATPAAEGGDTVDTGATEPAVSKVFTQAEVDEVVKTRLARERDKYKDYPELKRFKESNLSETEKAISEAKAVGRSEAQLEYATKLAGAEIKAALTGLVDDPISIIDDLNLSKFITEEGTVDSQAVMTLRDKYSGLVKAKAPRDVGHGRSDKVPAKDPKAELGRVLGLT